MSSIWLRLIPTLAYWLCWPKIVFMGDYSIPPHLHKHWAKETHCIPSEGLAIYYIQIQIETWCKVEKILKGSLNSIPSPSPSVKIQIKGGNVCLRCKGKTLLGVVNKLLKTKSLLTTPSNVLTLHLKQIFPPIIWIFTKGEGDGIESRLTLLKS